MSSLSRIRRKHISSYLFLLSLAVFFLASPPSGYGHPLYPAPPKIKSGGKKGSRVRPPKTNKAVKKNTLGAVPPLPAENEKLLNLPSAVNAVHISVKPGQTKTIYLSRAFINRISFSHYIDYARTSKTGDVSVTLNGRNAIVVFSPYMIESGAVKKVVYPKVPSSILFKSGNSVVSLLLVPKNIPPQTVYINSFADFKSRSFHSNGGFSKYVAKVFRDIYAQRIPKGYMLKKKDIIYKSNYPQVAVKLVKEYKGRFTVYEYLIKNLSNNEISLSNKEFLHLKSNVLAISLSNEHLFKNTFTRLLIMGE